jgi:hypothetical protein
MPDYSKTIIYKLINYDYPELVYVGSTTNFTKRKQQHKCGCLNNTNNKKNNIKVYLSIRENGGWQNWNMIKICDYPCSNKREAEQQEDKYMLELKANINIHRAYRNQKEFYEENKDKFKEYKKANNEKIKEYQKEYHKQYSEDNKDKINQNKKKYYDNNKTKIREKQMEKIICKCGCEVNRHNLKKHQNSIKHNDLMNNQSL